MTEIKILKENVNNIKNIDQNFDLIYMDPPFGLQRDFKMLETNGEEKGFSDYWNSFDDYIDWYANVINDCFEKLNENGWIYAHNNFIGNALVLSKINKKVRNCFYTNISWKRSGPKNNIKNGWGNIVDSIITFRKGNPYFDVEYTDLDPIYEANSFKNKDNNGFYALAKVTGEKSRPGKKYEYKGYLPEYGFRVSLDKLTELEENNLLHFGKNNIYKKIYSHESKGVPIQNLWDDVYFISRSEKNKRKYPTQKPLKMLERIVKTSCPVNGWVLDPFCGSGTTAISCFNLGRNCITMDINDEAVEIATNSINDLKSTTNNIIMDLLIN
jgi:DNA modification methylase